MQRMPVLATNLPDGKPYRVSDEKLTLRGDRVVVRRDIPLQSRRFHRPWVSVRDAKELRKDDVICLSGGYLNRLYDSRDHECVVLLTTKCNCSCIMCPQENNESTDQLSLDLGLISSLPKTLESVIITGGEPTCYEGRLIEVIRACERKLPSSGVTILTNAILLSDMQYVKRLYLLHHPSLTFEVSLNADVDSLYHAMMGVDAFYLAIEGILNLYRFGFRVAIRVVIQQLNYQRLPRIAEFVYKNLPFVSHIAFMGLEMEAEANRNADRVWIAHDSIAGPLRSALTFLSRTELKGSIYNLPLCVLARDLWQYARKSISPWKRVYLERCQDCPGKEECGGLFRSLTKIAARFVQPIVPIVKGDSYESN